MRIRRFLFSGHVIMTMISIGIVFFLFGFYVGKHFEAETQILLRENVYGGKYSVLVEYSDSNGKNQSLSLVSSGARWPRKAEDGSVYIKENPPFITRKTVGYDIGNLIMISDENIGGFWFSFCNAPTPDSITVRRWHREVQGTTGTLENGELLEYAKYKNEYYIAEMVPHYIYSIYATWGQYYGEYAFLVTDNSEDCVGWTLQNS